MNHNDITGVVTAIQMAIESLDSPREIDDADWSRYIGMSNLIPEMAPLVGWAMLQSGYTKEQLLDVMPTVDLEACRSNMIEVSAYHFEVNGKRCVSVNGDITPYVLDLETTVLRYLTEHQCQVRPLVYPITELDKDGTAVRIQIKRSAVLRQMSMLIRFIR